MAENIKGKVKHLYDTAANLTSDNPTLLAGELAIESDTNKFKYGDGSTLWNSLDYSGGGDLPTDPTFDSVTVTGGVTIGSNFIINNGVASGANVILGSLGYTAWNINNESGALRFHAGGVLALNIDDTGTSNFTQNVVVSGASQFNGNVGIGNGVVSPSLTFNAASGGSSNIAFQDVGITRWIIAKDASNNLTFNRFDAAGGYLDQPLSISTTGAISTSISVTAPNIIVDNGAADGGNLTFKSSGYTDWYMDANIGELRTIQGGSVRHYFDGSGNGVYALDLHVQGTLSTTGGITGYYNSTQCDTNFQAKESGFTYGRVFLTKPTTGYKNGDVYVNGTIAEMCVNSFSNTWKQITN